MNLSVSVEKFPSMRTGGRMCTRALTSFIPNDLKLEMISVSFYTVLSATSQAISQADYAK